MRAALVHEIDEPVYLLGHSYRAHVALGAASFVPDRVRKLVLYEPPWPRIVAGDATRALAARAQAGDWDSFSRWFFLNVLSVPKEEIDNLRITDLWAPIVADAMASLGDLRALASYDFQPDHFGGLRMPVLLQTGTESPHQLYVTDTLVGVLADSRIETLVGQAHEGMTTAPALYASTVIGFPANGG
jgi:pimeloyl-ACP methyl ester carboxylesterase